MRRPELTFVSRYVCFPKKAYEPLGAEFGCMVGLGPWNHTEKDGNFFGKWGWRGRYRNRMTRELWDLLRLSVPLLLV